MFLNVNLCLKMAAYMAQYLFDKDRQLYKRTVSMLHDHLHYCIVHMAGSFCRIRH